MTTQIGIILGLIATITIILCNLKKIIEGYKEIITPRKWIKNWVCKDCKYMQNPICIGCKNGILYTDSNAYVQNYEENKLHQSRIIKCTSCDWRCVQTWDYDKKIWEPSLTILDVPNHNQTTQVF